MDTTRNHPTGTRKPVGSLNISAKGKQFIQQWESLKLTYYDDSAGHCTVGWGNLVNGRQSCGQLGIASGTRISRTTAERFFADDLLHHVLLVKHVIRVPLYQHEFDALCSLAFNVGDIGKVAPRLCDKINRGHYTSAATELLDITNGGLPGLVKRRKAEAGMFLHGRYDGTH